MSIKIYNLGNLPFLEEIEIAEKIISKLKDINQYNATNVYRGLIADEKRLTDIKKFGTDRDPKQYQQQLIEQIGGEGRINPNAPELSDEECKEELKDAQSFCNPNAIFAGDENMLLEIIQKYANTTRNPDPDKFPLVLVYNTNCLIQKSIDFHEFKKEVEPLDALVCGVRFRDH